MIFDGMLQFMGTAGVVGSPDAPTVGTQQSTNVVDLVVARDMFIGDKIAPKLLVQVGTAFASGTSLQVQLQGAPDNAGVPGTWSTYVETPAIAEASLTAGRRIFDIEMPRPPAGVAAARFYRLQYISVGTHTAGSVYGTIVLDRFDQVDTKPGISIQN